jgi:hypothetical protein
MKFYAELNSAQYIVTLLGESTGSNCHEISEEEHEKIWQSLNLDRWKLENGVFIETEIVPSYWDNKTEAERRLAATDWVNQPDVYDPVNTPHLTNRDAFLAYRVQVRTIAVNSVDGNLDWPERPEAVWSS